MKKTKKKKEYLKVMWISIIGLITLFAYLDTIGFKMWNLIGGYPGQPYALAGNLYGVLFWSFASLMIISVSIMFYYFRRDISESLGIYVGTTIMLYGGLEDIIYYFLQGGATPLAFQWLFDNTYLGIIAKLLGETTLSWTTLLLQTFIAGLIVYFVLNILYKINFKMGKVRI